MDDPYIDNTTERSMDEQTRKALELARKSIFLLDIFDNEYETSAAIDAALSAPAAPVAQCVCSPDMLLDSYAGGAAPEGLFGRVTLLINGQRVDYVPASQPVSEPSEVSDADIRRVFLANGFTIKEGHDDLKPYVYAAARAVLALRPGAPRAPLTRDQVKAMTIEAGYGRESPACRAAFIDGIRHGERAYGIGQGGAA